ncbi:MAG: hypothetical protein WC145_13490 [Aliarcobacter sp.]|jgi:hypothetical protein
MSKHPRKPLLIAAALLMAAVLVPAVTAETVTLTFQDVGLATQDIEVFDATGAHLTTTNSSSVLSLNSSESNRYTLQLKPQATTVEPLTLADSVVAWLTQNALIVTLLLFGLLVLFRGGRR